MKTQLYNLPRPMLCDVEKDLDADGFPTMKAVREYMDLHSGAIRRLKYLSELYVGRHDILRAPDKEAWKPDNRLVVNFPRYITNISLGYGYGVPITKRFPDEKVEESIQQIEKRNHIVDHENQLFKKVFQMGHAWEFFYQNENAQTRMKVLTPMQFFCVYDDTLEERSVFAVRYGRKKDGKIYGEVYTREYQRKFFEGNWKGELEANPYGLIPAVEYMLNDERMGLYEDSAPLIEAYNRTLSEKTNDVDAFAEAYLAIIGTEVGSDQVRRIRDERVINIFGTDNADEIKNIVVQFLTKPTADATQENLLNRLERLIFQISMSANISDDSFGNVASGEAMAYKLLKFRRACRSGTRFFARCRRTARTRTHGKTSSCSSTGTFRRIPLPRSRTRRTWRAWSRRKHSSRSCRPSFPTLPPSSNASPRSRKTCGHSSIHTATSESMRMTRKNRTNPMRLTRPMR